jgi:hypothetical protein
VITSQLLLRGDDLSDHDDKLQRLLDGEIDEAEIASDPTLSSLAERIFGLTIEPITPTKPSQSTGLPPLEQSTEPALNPMIEVVPGIAPPTLPTITTKIETGDGMKSSSGGKLMIAGGILLVVSLLNLFGVFGLLLGGICSGSICPDAGATRINWLSFYQITNGYGWGEPFPTMGIPDYAAILGSLVLILVGRRK